MEAEAATMEEAEATVVATECHQISAVAMGMEDFDWPNVSE